MKAKNHQETYLITKVEKEYDNSYSIWMGSFGCGLEKKYGVIPKVADNITIYKKGSRFGEIRGIDINGKEVFYKTNADLQKERTEWLRKNEEEKQKNYKKNKSKMDKQYNALPKFFKERIDKFRKDNIRFRIDDEEYELFCCEQAVLIAIACKTPQGLLEFSEKQYEEQKKQVPKLSDGHSGNTFGCACNLAYLYLKNIL